MKYFSISSVKKAYETVSANTKDKFWGIFGILYSIESIAKPGVNFNIDTCKLATFLEQTFRLKDKKSYDTTNSVYSVVFANDWETQTVANFTIATPDIMPVIVWAYRNVAFSHEFSAKELLEKFIIDFHISKDSVERFFRINLDEFQLEYTDTIYNDEDLLKYFGGSVASDAVTLKMNKSFVVANAGDLSRGPFFQPLYASLNTLECLIIFPFDAKEYYQVFNASEQKEFKELDTKASQTIYYGCPGSGKSHHVKDITENVDSNFVFRTTFHPDTDYASFIGCYKPCSNNKSLLNGNNLTEDELLKRFFDSKDEVKYKGDIKARYLYESLINTVDIKNLGENASTIADKLKNKGFDKTAYVTEANCMYKIYNWLKEDGYLIDSNITYEFLPQVFTNAYVKAWEDTSKPIYLIIEEINRGNCAQIFGDLFQLLDRDKATGKSEYPIKADKDLVSHIEGVLGVGHEGIKNGELCLPPNLIIYATMNTSDQSLFPMDSAFKRRWDWEYVPINYSKDIDSGKFIIEIDDDTKYNWVEFLESVNDKIYDATNSEDKQMGNFFIKKSIKANEFVNKVMFYLWNEVCKEEYGTQRNFFRKGKEGKTEFKFTELFGDNQATILKEFMTSLGVEPIRKKPEEPEAE